MAATFDNEMWRPELRSRAALWWFLHDLFRPPSPKQWAWLLNPPAQSAWASLSRVRAEGIPGQLPLPETLPEYEQSYIATFDVGVPEPPCPLIESHWNKRDPVPRVLHENLLFYKHFGLELRDSANEMADHLRHQLEFMQYLCHLEEERPGSEQQIQQARAEFLRRHLGYWVPMAARKLNEVAPGEWPSHWMNLLHACCEAEVGIE